MAIYTISTNPKNIGDIKYWFDSSDTSTLSLTGIGSVTASVISISDKISGVVLSSTGTVRPLYYYNIINNNNSIFFGFTNSLVDVTDSQAADRLSSNSCTFSSIGSIYTVTRCASTYIYQFAIAVSPSSRPTTTWGDYQVIYYSPGVSQVWSTIQTSPTSQVGDFIGPSNSSTVVDILGLRHNTNSLTKFHGIGTGVKNGYTNATYSISPLSNRLSIGDYYTFTSGDFGFRGYFCEFIYYTRYLTDNEHDKVIQYLKKKWIG
jgi:hypothetical protein